MCICIQNMKFLCLTMCQREVYTDDAGADASHRQSMIVKTFWLINQMSQKSKLYLWFLMHWQPQTQFQLFMSKNLCDGDKR